MVDIFFDAHFEKLLSKIKDLSFREKIIKQIAKVKDNPEIGKPMMYSRKGIRELYIPPYRLSYMYNKEGEWIVLLDLYHKDNQ